MHNMSYCLKSASLFNSFVIGSCIILYLITGQITFKSMGNLHKEMIHQNVLYCFTALMWAGQVNIGGLWGTTKISVWPLTGKIAL